MDPGVGGHGRADVDPDGGGVDELHVGDARGVHSPDVLRQRPVPDFGLQGGDQALQHHSGLAGSGHPCDHGESPLGDVHFQGLYRVNLICGQVDGAKGKQVLFGCPGTPGLRPSRQEGADLRDGVGLDLGDGPLGDDVAAPGPSLRAHLHHPVRFFQNLRVVVHQNNGVAVGH